MRRSCRFATGPKASFETSGHSAGNGLPGARHSERYKSLSRKPPQKQLVAEVSCCAMHSRIVQVGPRCILWQMVQDEIEDDELQAMVAVGRIFARLTDPEARRRIRDYIDDRFLGGSGGAGQSGARAGGGGAGAGTPVGAGLGTATGAGGVSGRTEDNKEIAGIAKLGSDGDLRITIRDLKARSGLDAALRLALVSIYAHQKLAGTPLSSAKGLTPILKLWRLYDGNSRTRLAKEKGIVRTGDELSLDAHATRDAERFIEEILDPAVDGVWRAK